jgi:hypothetical protein
MVVIAEGTDLRRADRREVARVKKQEHGAVCPRVLEALDQTVVRREDKIGRLLVNGQKVRHGIGLRKN